MALGAAIAGAFGIVVDEGTQAEIVDYIVVAMSGIGGLVAIYGRLKAKKRIER